VGLSVQKWQLLRLSIYTGIGSICTGATPSPGIQYFSVNMETPCNHMCYTRLCFYFLIPDYTIGALKSTRLSDLLSSVQKQSSVTVILISGMKVVPTVTAEEQQKYLLAEETSLCRRQKFLVSELKALPTCTMFVGVALLADLPQADSLYTCKKVLSSAHKQKH